MKKVLTILIVIFSIFLLTSCKEEQNNPDKVLRGKEGRKTLDLRDAPPEEDIRKRRCC